MDNGQQGPEMRHAMTPPELTKPVTSPPAQANHLSCIGRDRGKRDRGGSARQADPQARPRPAQRDSPATADYQLSAHTDHHPTGLPPTFSLGEAVRWEKYPISKNI